jgi:hypothetical protein
MALSKHAGRQGAIQRACRICCGKLAGEKHHASISTGKAILHL